MQDKLKYLGCANFSQLVQSDLLQVYLQKELSYLSDIITITKYEKEEDNYFCIMNNDTILIELCDGYINGWSLDYFLEIPEHMKNLKDEVDSILNDYEELVVVSSK